MGLTLDFSADQQTIDNVESVTFTSVRLAGNSTASVTDAGFYPQPTGEGAPSFGVYTKGLARFSIKASEISSIGGAKPRDTITMTGGDVYTVLTAHKPVISGVWQILGVNLVLAADLRTTGTLTRPSNTQDSAKRMALSSYSTITSGVACRVQPVESQATDILERRTIARRYVAFLASTLDARAKDVFTTADGTAYTVKGFRNPERIDELYQLDLERVL